MKKLVALLSIVTSSVCIAFPMEDIYNNLDITTFNSSLIPMRTGDETRFSDFKNIAKPIITESKIVIEDSDWVYTIQAIKENKKGIYICFTDKAKKSSYDAQEPMIIRKYGDQYISLRLYTKVCKDYAR